MTTINEDLLSAAKKVCYSYDKGNGKFDDRNLPTLCSEHLPMLVALGIFTLSKLNNTEALELLRLKAVSKKHSELLASASTGKHDFTSLYEKCKFINKIDVNLQSFTFKRESRNIKIELELLKTHLTLLGLELIAEERETRSGTKIVEYYYDVKQETTNQGDVKQETTNQGDVKQETTNQG